MRLEWKDGVPVLFLLAMAPWMAGLLFAALVGSHYVPGYLEFWDFWRLYRPSPHYRILLAVSATLPVVLAMTPLLAAARSSRPSLFGDAHFADEREIRAAGLRASSGIILGRLRGRLLRASGQIGILLFAPPRSGKGVGFVIPNLLDWPGSALVNDIKLANYAITSGTRAAMGQRVILFAPLDPNGRTHAYNPLDFVSKDKQLRTNDVQGITAKLVPTPPRTDPMWTNEARALLDALILLLLDAGRGASLGAVYRMVLSTSDFPRYLMWIMAEYEGRLDDTTVMQFNGFLGKASKEQSGVLSTLKAALSIFGNPLIDRATSSSDFDLTTLRRVPTSLYLGVMPRDVKRLTPLLNIFVQQTFDSLLGELPGNDEPHSLLALLDEFTALGRLDNVEKGIGYFASYNIILAPIIQDLSQLEEAYGRAVTETFLATANVRIAYAQNNLRAAKYLSEEIGYRTINTETRSTSAFGKGGAQRSQSKARRELILPHEIRELDDRDQLILVEARPPIRAKKIRYFRDRAFKRRLRPSLERPRLRNTIITPPRMPEAKIMTADDIDEVISAIEGS